MPPYVIVIIAVSLLLLGMVIIPIVNRRQFHRLSDEQKVRILMKQSKGLRYFKNISNGRTGTLIYIKNKRKIYTYPWILEDGKLFCTRKNLFEKWDYPEEQPRFTEDEKVQALEALEEYNQKHTIKIYLNDEANK